MTLVRAPPRNMSLSVTPQLGDTMYVFGGYNGQQRFDKLIPVDMATREDRLARSVQQLEAELRHAQQR